jgi:hypothetical protein
VAVYVSTDARWLGEGTLYDCLSRTSCSSEGVFMIPANTS